MKKGGNVYASRNKQLQQGEKDERSCLEAQKTQCVVNASLTMITSYRATYKLKPKVLQKQMIEQRINIGGTDKRPYLIDKIAAWIWVEWHNRIHMVIVANHKYFRITLR